MKEKKKYFFSAVGIYCIYKIYMALADIISKMLISLTATNEYSLSDEVISYQKLTDLYNVAYSKNKYGYAMVYEIVFLIILLVCVNKYRDKIKLPKIKNMIFSGIIGSSLAVIVTFALNIVELPILIDYAKIYESVFSGGELTKFFYVIFFQAMFEEILFRYVLFGFFRKVFNPYISSSIISIIFAMEHGNIVWFIYTFIFSLIIMVVYVKTNDFLTCIVMHVFFNGISTFLGYIGTIQFFSLYFSLIISIIALIFSMHAILKKRYDYE